MRGLVKILIGLIGSAILALLVAFVGYDLLEFQPHMANIRNLIAKAAPSEQAPPNTLVRVVHVAHPEPALSAYVARMLIHELDAVPKAGGMGYWHLKSAIWWALVLLHLSGEERLALFLALSYMGPTGQGYANASMAVAGTRLEGLSLDQAARLVSFARSPSRFVDDVEKLERRSAELLEQVRSAP